MSRVCQIETLFAFLCAIEPDVDTAVDEHVAYPKKMRIEVILRERSGRVVASPSTIVTLGPESELGHVRKQFAAYVKHPPHLLKFVYKTQVLYGDEYDALTIRAARIQYPHPVLHCYTMNEGDVMTRPSHESPLDALIPRYLLSNHTPYFELLLDLLRVGADVGTSVWHLLCRLPVNDALAQHVRGVSLRDTMGHPDWEVLIGTAGAMLRLLYTMQVRETAHTWSNCMCAHILTHALTPEYVLVA